MADKRRKRCMISLDEIMDRALDRIADREMRTRSAVGYMLLKESPRMVEEMKRVSRAIYGPGPCDIGGENDGGKN